MPGSAGEWYNNCIDTNRRQNRNIHGFLFFLRSKLIHRISQDILWKQYLGYHHTQLGIKVPVNQCEQELEKYQITWLENERKPMISNNVLNDKFVDGLLPGIGDKVRLMVDWDMKFDAIVGITEKI